MSDLIEEMPLPNEVLFGGEGDVLAVPSDDDRPAYDHSDEDAYGWDA